MLKAKAINDFLADVKVEAVKLQLQLAAPSRDEKMRNDVLGNVFIEHFKADKLLETIRNGIKEADGVNAIAAIHDLYKKWDDARIDLQFHSFYGPEQSAEAYGYIFLMRVARRFPELVPPKVKT